MGSSKKHRERHIEALIEEARRRAKEYENEKGRPYCVWQSLKEPELIYIAPEGTECKGAKKI